MTKLSELSLKDRAHWQLHLGAVLKDTPSLKAEVGVFTKGGELPALKQPWMIHDWLERPEFRKEIEGWE